MILAELKKQNGFLEPEVSPPKPAKKKSRKTVRKTNLILNLMVFIFVFSIIGVGLYVHSALLGYEIVALKKEITTLENENNRIEYTIAELSSLERIEMEAQERLGMFKPQPKNMVALACETRSVPAIQLNDQMNTEQTASVKKDYQIISSILDRVRLTGSF